MDFVKNGHQKYLPHLSIGKPERSGGDVGNTFILQNPLVEKLDDEFSLKSTELFEEVQRMRTGFQG